MGMSLRHPVVVCVDRIRQLPSRQLSYRVGSALISKGALERLLERLLFEQLHKLSRLFELQKSFGHVRFLGELGNLAEHR